jgi:hypothetical protein
LKNKSAKFAASFGLRGRFAEIREKMVRDVERNPGDRNTKRNLNIYLALQTTAHRAIQKD